MNYQPRNRVEGLAIQSALMANCEYHLYDANQERVRYRVIRENPDGTFEMERLADQPAEAPSEVERELDEACADALDAFSKRMLGGPRETDPAWVDRLINAVAAAEEEGDHA